MNYICCKIAHIAGIHLFPLERYYLGGLCAIGAGMLEKSVPSIKARVLNQLILTIGTCAKRILPRFLIAFSLNWILVYCGASNVNESKKKDRKGYNEKPLISSFQDFCNPDKALIYAPCALRELIEQIIYWRNQNSGNDYAVPPKYCLSVQKIDSLH